MLIGAGTTINAGINVAVPLPAPSSVITSSSSVNEGSTITFTSTSTGVPDGTLYWTRYGGTANDADFSAVNGSFTVTNGVGTFTVTPIADHLTEGTELFSVVVRTGSITGPIIGTSADKEILDTSQTPTYTLSTVGNVTSINEGSALTFNVATTEVDDGTTLYWETGDNFNGVVGGRFSPDHYGTVTINSNAVSFTITISADNTTAISNPQSYVLRLYSGNYGAFGGTLVDSLEITVNDTSQTPPTHGSAVINQPENDYLKIDGPGTGIIKRGPDANGQDYAGSTTIFSIPFFADGVVETIPIFSGGWTITFKNGQTRTITSVATGYNGAITYGLNLDSPLYAGANEVFPAVIKSSDFVDRPWNLGTTWTIEFWIYMNYGSNDNTHIQGGIWGLLNQGGWATTDSINIALSGGYLQINQGNNTAYYNKLVIEPTPLQWVHVAIVNNAGTNKVYYDGIEQVPPANIGSRDYTASWTNSTNPLFIGCLGRSDNNDTGGGSFDGKITNLRITNTAVYAANFYPPTTLPTKISGTKLLWNPTDQALTTDTSDSAATITNNGVTYDSSYPLSDVLDVSAVFDGSTLRYYKVAGGSHFQLGTTWTIEWWQKSVDNTTVPNGKLYAVMGQYPDGGRIDIYYQNGSLKVQNGQALCAEPPAGEWVHVALVNDAGSGTVYYNGVAQSATGNFGNYGQTQDLYIGKRGSITYQPFNGKITNIRITDTAVYTANFVPDILPTRITGHTKLLLTPTVDTVYGVDKGDNNLAIQSSGIRFNSDYPQVVVGGTITDTVTGDSGLYGIDYTTKTGVTVGSIAVKDAATLGSVSIVGTTIFYLAPCFQGSYNEKTGYDHQGTEIDNFSLYFTGNFGKTIVPVSVTINAV